MPVRRFCIVRGASGLISSVFNTYENLGNTRSEGIDFGVSYTSKEYNWGKIELSFDGTYIYGDTASVVQGLNPNGSLFFRVFDQTDLADTVGPDLKFNASAFYSKTLFGIDTFRTGLTLYYVGSETRFQ